MIIQKKSKLSNIYKFAIIMFLLLQTGGCKAMYTLKSGEKAREFPVGLDWLNTEYPLTLEDLKGKVVLLDFWAYCCINCIHILPELQNLEEKYGNDLVVIGVHSAKFAGEKDTGNIRDAILRYEIAHPVINDHKFILWQKYNIHAWPSMVLIDPEGNVIATQSGEGAPDLFDPLIESTINEYEKQGKMNHEPLNLVLEKDGNRSGILSYPGKIRASEDETLLFISDSNHNRILIVSRQDGTIKDIIGDGQIGWKDGSFEEARLNHPQGIVQAGDYLYIADTENHLLRKANLKNRTVETIAGTGRQASFMARGGSATKTSLNSPWDLEYLDDKIFIAMAGPHQIWIYYPDKEKVDVWAGSGRENITDGPLHLAALAQPSGITTDSDYLYFADSEVSAIRRVDKYENGEVNTIVGMGLFEFGDVDGVGSEVRLQHPLGISWYNDNLYVADTYNNKIKVINPSDKSSKTLAGSGKEGFKDGAFLEAEFDEPSGLYASSDGLLYVADTNNHLIRVLDLKSGIVSTLNLKNLPMLNTGLSLNSRPIKETDSWQLKPGSATLTIDLEFPDNLKLNNEGGIRATIYNASEHLKVKSTNPVISRELPVNIDLNIDEHQDQVSLNLEYYYCQKKNEGLCYYEEVSLKIPLEFIENGNNNFKYKLVVK